MMLTIRGLPRNVKPNDVKALIARHCNILDFILDNLQEDDLGKKVRVGLADDAQGSLVMRNLDGFNMGGYRIRVEPVSKSSITPQGGFGPNEYRFPCNQVPAEQPGSYQYNQMNTTYFHQGPRPEGPQIDHPEIYINRINETDFKIRGKNMLGNANLHIDPKSNLKRIETQVTQNTRTQTKPFDMGPKSGFVQDKMGPYHDNRTNIPDFQPNYPQQNQANFQNKPNWVQNPMTTQMQQKPYPEKHYEQKGGMRNYSSFADYSKPSIKSNHNKNDSMFDEYNYNNSTTHPRQSPTRKPRMSPSGRNSPTWHHPDGRTLAPNEGRMSPGRHHNSVQRMSPDRFPPNDRMSPTRVFMMAGDRYMSHDGRRVSPVKQNMSSGRLMSPGRQMMPPSRGMSPGRQIGPGRGMSPGRQTMPPGRGLSPGRQTMPPGRGLSPGRQMMPPGRGLSPGRQMASGRGMSPGRHVMPPGRGISPSRQMTSGRGMSPVRQMMLISPVRQIPTCRSISPRRQMMPPGRGTSPGRLIMPPGRGLSPGRQMMPPGRGTSPGRLIMPPGRGLSPGRQMMPPGRSISPGRVMMTRSPIRDVLATIRGVSSPGRHISPVGRQILGELRDIPSPPRRRKSPPGRRVSGSPKRMSPNGMRDLRNKEMEGGRPPGDRRASPYGKRANRMSPGRRLSSSAGKRMSPSISRMSPGRRQFSGRRVTPKPASPRRKFGSPGKKKISRHGSPNVKRVSPNRRRVSPNRRRMSPNRRRVSPNQQRVSPNRRRVPSGQGMGSPRRMSPNQRRPSPGRRSGIEKRMSPTAIAFDERNKQSPLRFSPRLQSNKNGSPPHYGEKNNVARSESSSTYQQPTAPNHGNFSRHFGFQSSYEEQRDDVWQDKRPKLVEEGILRPPTRRSPIRRAFSPNDNRASRSPPRGWAQERRSRSPHEPPPPPPSWPGATDVQWIHKDKSHQVVWDTRRDDQPDYDPDPKQSRQLEKRTHDHAFPKFEGNESGDHVVSDLFLDAKYRKVADNICKRIMFAFHSKGDNFDVILKEMNRIVFKTIQELCGGKDMPVAAIMRRFRKLHSERDERALYKDILAFTNKAVKDSLGPSAKRQKTSENLKDRDNAAMNSASHLSAKATPSKATIKGAEVAARLSEKEPQKDECEPSAPGFYELSPHGYYELSPLMERGLKKELNALIDKIFLTLPDTARTEAEKHIVDIVKNDAALQIANVVGLNVAKRVLNVFHLLHVYITFHCTGDLPASFQRDFGKFKRKFKIISMRRIQQKPVYLAQMGKYTHFDDLCAIQQGIFDGIEFSVRPMHKVFTDKPKLLKYKPLESLERKIEPTKVMKHPHIDEREDRMQIMEEKFLSAHKISQKASFLFARMYSREELPKAQRSRRSGRAKKKAKAQAKEAPAPAKEEPEINYKSSEELDEVEILHLIEEAIVVDEC